MRPVLLLIVLLFLPARAFAMPQKGETLTFERVIDGATIKASGETISLWGVKALNPADANSLAANLYLETMLKKGDLICREVSAARDRRTMHCYSDGADVGSLMVQMGMVRAADPYYQGEEEYARAERHGVWRGRQGTPLH
jgi:endonuclease YncB( thermonuclease family)